MSTMPLHLLALGCLATYRLSLLLADDRGPFGILESFRRRAATLHPELAELLQCTWCLSFWLGFLCMLPALPYGLSTYLLAALAASGFTVLVEIASGRD